MPTESFSSAWVRRLVTVLLLMGLGLVGLLGPAQAGTIEAVLAPGELIADQDRKSTRLNSSH